MNIFNFHPLNLRENAASHPDKLVIKMCLEATQLINNHLDNPLEKIKGGFYKRTHVKHPCSIWIGESKDNLTYTICYLISLMEEYERRYNKPSNYRFILDQLDPTLTVGCMPKNFPIAINEKWLDMFVTDGLINSKTKEHILKTKRSDDPNLVGLLYRSYLNYAKTHYAEYKFTNPPLFWRDCLGSELGTNNAKYCKLTMKR